MYKSVVFYNHGNLGDSFLSRPFFKELKKILIADKYYLSNKFNLNYFEDLFDGHISFNQFTIPNNWFYHDIENNILYFNTWYGMLLHNVTKEEYTKIKTYDSILYNWDSYLFFFSLCLKKINNTYSIDYMNNNKFNFLDKKIIKLDIEIPLLKDFRKKILIFNQEATSGQSDNADFTPFIKKLSEDKNIIIYTSKPINYYRDNIINLSDYINYPDLDIISEISKKIDIICGPGNATVISTWNFENILNENKIYITINRNNIGEAIFFKEVKCKNFVVNSVSSLFNILNKNLYGEYV